MPLVQKKVAIAANTIESNILAGDPFEFLMYNAEVLFGFNQSATGLTVDVFTGTDLIVSELEPLVSATYPDSDQMDVPDLVGAGERITVRVNNTTGGALDLYYKLLITPLV
ncbi:MAG: hypothetical protein ACC669_09355 [bacterium]